MNFGEMFGMAYQPEYLLLGSVTPQLVSYTTPGSFTETIPAGFSVATIEAWGGGGGTGLHIYTGGCCPVDWYSSSGGSGGYSRQVINVTGQGGKTLSLVVGAKGAKSITKFYGSVGGDTTVSSGTFTITTMTAGGGEMGVNNDVGFAAAFTVPNGSSAGTSLVFGPPGGGRNIGTSMYVRAVTGGTTIPFGTVIISGPNFPYGTYPINKTITAFTTQTVTLDGGSGGRGGPASGGAVNTTGNTGGALNLTAPNANTVGITGLYGGPYGFGAGDDSTDGGPGAIIIRYS